MGGTVDLHIHSTYSSDGDYTPAELVQMALEGGLVAISIADHDTVAGYPEALEVAAGSGVEVVPGMEVTTLYDDREHHVLLPFVDWESPVIAKIAERITRGRLVEARERVEKLREYGLKISWEEVDAATRSAPVLGVTIAQLLLEKPESKDDPLLKKYFGEEEQRWAAYHFYRDFFLEGRPAFVQKRHIPLLEVLELAPRAGAVPVLAHPGAYFQNSTREDLVRLKERGLVGLEVYTSYHKPEQTALYLEIAKELDLVPTAGSDFHGRIKPHVDFGSVKDGGPWMVEELRKRRI